MGQDLLIIKDSWSKSVRHTTLGRTPLDEWSARRKDLRRDSNSLFWRGGDKSPQCARASSFTRFLEHTHSDLPYSVGLLWTSDQLVTETSTWQQLTLTTDGKPCPRWDANPQSQQPQTYVLDGAVTVTGVVVLIVDKWTFQPAVDTTVFVS